MIEPKTDSFSSPMMAFLDENEYITYSSKYETSIKYDFKNVTEETSPIFKLMNATSKYLHSIVGSSRWPKCSLTANRVC